MQGKSSRTRGYRTAIWATVILMGMALTLTLGQDVILNPVEITGQVRVGTEPLGQVSMRATSGSFQATQTFVPDEADPTTVNYSLTVDVPAGGDRTYSVQPDQIWMNEFKNRLFLLAQDVLVEDGVPGSADFIIEPGFIEGTITITGGEVLTGAIVNGLYKDSPSSGLCRSRFNAPCFAASASVDQGLTYRMAVVPDTEITLRLEVNLESGVRLTLDPIMVDIPEGVTVVQDFEVLSPTGGIVGTIEIPGAEVPLSHFVFVNGDASKFAELDVDGPYELTGLPDGDFVLHANSNFGERTAINSYIHPGASMTPGRSVNISGGEQVTVDVRTEQAYIEGTVSVSGSATQDDVRDSTFTFRGISSETSGAFSLGRLPDPATGAYRFVASQGAWHNSQATFFMQREGTQLEDQFSESLILSLGLPASPEFQATTGETSAYDADFPMGKVTVRFAVAGDLPLSNPLLQIGCSLRNEAGQFLMGVNGNSRGENQVDVTEAITSFLAPGSACLVTARAVVDGTLTSFGQVEVEVEPGVDKDIQVGAPTLIIDFPSPGLEVNTPILAVLGRASDDVDVTSVTINGGDPLALTSTGNADDPVEVSFTGQELTLAPGANEIVTTAMDNDGNTTTDTRTVFFVTENSPPTLNWTPADGSTTSETTVEVTGTADDDEGIASITVNGANVSFVLTGNSSQPNEVSFTTTVTLVTVTTTSPSWPRISASCKPRRRTPSRSPC